MDAQTRACLFLSHRRCVWDAIKINELCSWVSHFTAPKKNESVEPLLRVEKFLIFDRAHNKLRLELNFLYLNLEDFLL